MNIDRLKNSTTPKGWKKVRNIAGTVATVGALVLAAPVSIPTVLATWITYATLVAGTVAGTSHLTKK